MDVSSYRVDARARVVLGAALLPTVLGLAWLVAEGFVRKMTPVGPFELVFISLALSPAVLVALPLAARTELAFRILCVADGTVLLVLNVPGVYVALFQHLPEVALLSVAAGLHNEVPARTGRVVLTSVAVLTAVLAVVWAVAIVRAVSS